MDRRSFIMKSCGGMILLSCPGLRAGTPDKNTRFGLVTDIHYADRKVNGTRYYDQSIAKLTEAVNIFNSEKLEFLIELGDLKDQGTNPDKTETLTFLDQIESTLKKFNGPVYHVLGNHDMDSISKEDFLGHIRNHGKAGNKPYYSFIRNKLKFIVLDANHHEDGSDYNNGNFDWTKAFIPQTQKEWLNHELEESKYPVIVFSHQMLDSFSDIDKKLCVGNADEIVNILERHKKVITVFQGHHHPGHYSYRNNIHYYTMKGMIEGSFPENSSYGIIEVQRNLNINITGFRNCGNKLMKHNHA